METTDRVENLLALILVNQLRDKPLRERASILSAAGFSNIEIADLLNTTPATIAQVLHEHRRTKRSKRQTGPARR